MHPYSKELLLSFSGDEYAAFLAAGGRRLRPRHARALELATIRPSMRVLDIGCGRGEVALHLARAGATVNAVDFSPDCLALTAQTLALGQAEERKRARLSGADAVALPFEDAVFDRVLFLDVAEHLLPWQLQCALGEIRRVLRQGGYAVIHTLPNRWALEIGYPLLRLVWPALPSCPRSAYERRVHVNELSLIDLHRALNAAGLEARVWLEGWTAIHAAWSQGCAFPDPVRRRAYPLLRRRAVRAIATLILHTPLRLIFANDLFAIAWPRGAPAPPPLWPRAWCERFITHHVLS